MGITRVINKYWQKRRQRHYLKSRLHLALDIVMLVLVALMAALMVYVMAYHPNIIQSFQPGPDKTPPPVFVAENLPFDLSADLSRSGENFLLKIRYKNDYRDKLEKVRLSFSVPGAAKIESFSLIDGLGWQDAGNYIEAADMPAGAAGEINLLFRLSGAKEKLAIGVSASYSSGNNSANDNFSSNEIIIPAQLSVSASAYYYSRQGDQLGIGPIPPIVGIPTRYWVLVDASASGDLSSFALSAYLPSGARFTGNKTMIAGQMSYNESARQIIWQVSDLVSDQKASCGFEVEITPEFFQVGEVPVLVERIMYSAYDERASESISGERGKIDASLPDDKLAGGNGKVRK